jgi:hypothetical protein
LQRAELFDHQEPEDDDGATGVQEVLQPLPQAHAAQGSEVAVASGQWLVVSKGKTFLIFDHRSLDTDH